MVQKSPVRPLKCPCAPQPKSWESAMVPGSVSRPTCDGSRRPCEPSQALRAFGEACVPQAVSRSRIGAQPATPARQERGCHSTVGEACVPQAVSHSRAGAQSARACAASGATWRAGGSCARPGVKKDGSGANVVPTNHQRTNQNVVHTPYNIVLPVPAFRS